jgi:hypothetical protein
MKIVLGFLGLLALPVVWLIYRAIAGGRRAYRSLLARIAPITEALGAGRDPSEVDLLAFAGDRGTRRVLYDVLDHQGKLHLFPKQFLTWDAMAEAELAAWLNHPNELGSPPDEMELMAKVRATGADAAADRHYFVFRFRAAPPHWAAKDGWLAGIAGPYDMSQEPRPSGSGTSSRFESFDSRTPEQHVEMLDRRSTKGRS